MDLPDVVTGRWWHSLAAWTVTLSASWIIVFGGVGISDTMAVIELSKLLHRHACMYYK